MRLRSSPLVLGLVLLFPGPASAETPPGGERAGAEAEAKGSSPTAEELALAGKLLSPCCWTQTIDVHGSGIAMELRREIRSRLAAGDSPEQIEADIVARYGERIRAVPESSPLGAVAATLLTVVGLAGVGMLFIGLRWRRRAKARPEGDEDEKAPTAAVAGSEDTEPRDALDERLEAELRDV